ncbi:hypothetical protein GmRootV35_21570 [Variovorax sp. V35]
MPTLAQRALELRGLGLPGSSVRLMSGRELQFRFSVTPGRFGRDYECLLRVRPDSRTPDMFVIAPNLRSLAGSDSIPHIYRHDGPGVLLCLWWPKRREWAPQLKLTETFIPWTEEWLWYFEDWLRTRKWAGGGMHPEPSRKRRLSWRPRVPATPALGERIATIY